MHRLENKAAIITGAAGGMGEAMARLFASEGAKVLATDRQEEKLKRWVDAARQQGARISCMAHDISLEADWKLIAGRAIELYGKIDILVNNAGVFPPGATMDSTTLDDWNKLLSINLNGAFIGTRTCVPFMRMAGGGSIINVSSIAGLVGGNGPAYTASKGALRLLTKDNAVELAKDNIRVNSIHPGGVATPMTEFLLKAEDSDELIKNMCPMGRIGKPEEIAYGALYLASDEASYVTGAELVIDGGLVAR
ncbi:MAG: glucose 1-dehydrogenase [Bacteroidetes bacterium]|nr:glucose 1-dehydrogenase [Bacteroidota bacterium]